jgi:hypothetical protein
VFKVLGTLIIILGLACLMILPGMAALADDENESGAVASVTIVSGENEGPTGGSSGGGGGSSPGGTTYLFEYANNDGEFFTDAIAESFDGQVQLYIPKGTIGQNKYGQRLYSVSIKEYTTPPAPPADCNFVGLNYDIGPAGATFDPPIYLTLKYTDSQVPDGVAEENLKLATWLDGKWVPFEGGVVDPVNNTITVSINHFSIYTVMAYTSPASFVISGMTVSPTEVHANESVTISVTITNTGDLNGSYDVTLKINNSESQIKKVTLDGGQVQTVSFAVTSDTTGEYSIEINGLSGKFKVKPPVPEGTVAEVTLPMPASFTISDLSISPDEVNPDEEVTISTVVTNIGGSQGSYLLVLNINNQEKANQEVELEANQSQKVSFTTVAKAGGNNSVDINGKTGEFNVIVPPPPLPGATDEIPSVPSIKWPLYVGVTAAFGGMFIIVLISVFSRRRQRIYRTWSR